MAAPVASYAPSASQSYGVDYRAPVAHQWRGYDDDWNRRGYDRGYDRRDRDEGYSGGRVDRYGSGGGREDRDRYERRGGGSGGWVEVRIGSVIDQ